MFGRMDTQTHFNILFFFFLTKKLNPGCFLLIKIEICPVAGFRKS